MNEFQMIENKSMYDALIQGAKRVIEKKDTLNQLNVFPVQDQDTGNNLSALMKSIIEQTKLGNTIDETLESLADAALIGSRGNSGLIFSQFLYGLTKAHQTIDYPEFIRRIESGVIHAYKAINEPVEGTMVTLMRKLSETLKNTKQPIDNIEAYVDYIIQELNMALEQTKLELEVLKTFGVVDAGALGFTLFVEGFLQSITNRVTQDVIEPSISFEEPETIEHDHMDITYRYCTEVLLQTTTDKHTLKELLDQLGDSLVIGETKRLKRVHLHTNHPEIIVEKLSHLGQILESKVDDMRKQYQATQAKDNEICILTDSIADLPKIFVDSHPIHVYPIGINFNDIVYYDKLTINNHQLFHYISKHEKFPTSFTPSFKAIDAQINFLLKHYKKLIILTVSSKMSGIHNLFTKALEGYKDKDVLLIDTKQNSVSEGLIVYEVAKMIEQKMPFEDIKLKVNKLVKNTKILVHVDTLDNMVRSGRIKKSLGTLGKLLKLKPIVSINDAGEGVVLSKTIGQKRNINKLVNMVDRIHKTSGIENYAIVHVSNLKLAEKIKTQIIKKIGKAPVYVGEISSIIAMNSGLNSIAIGFIRKDL
ncbi:DegV family EDD domain-containing protein [Acholeplasma laidlawii]|uniref:DegV family protein n=1 Tax=Acholeplasma laidlawii TaxID=2148 RepID=UPI0018C21D3F|nr:DegV family protein [Acholeplasma laidlawii]MBG0762824.1 DegV family EDD domain-containing protein [Acholeplasma laidlawii]